MRLLSLQKVQRSCAYVRGVQKSVGSHRKKNRGHEKRERKVRIYVCAIVYYYVRERKCVQRGRKIKVGRAGLMQARAHTHTLSSLLAFSLSR